MNTTTDNTITFNLEEMMHVTSRLTELLTEETRILRTMKFKGISKSVDEKSVLSTKLEQYKQHLKENPSLLKTFSQDALSRFKLNVKNFETALEEDRRELIKARKVQSIVMTTIKTALAKQMTSATGYTKNGYAGDSQVDVATTPPLTVSKYI